MQGRDLTPEEKTAFIKKLKSTNGNVSKACQMVKISRNAVYEHRKTDAEFAEQWDEALEAVYDEMEQEMYRRAVKGVVEPLVYKGQMVKDEKGKIIQIRKYSDRLLEFALKGNRPEKFRERVDINQNVSGSLAVNVESAIDNLYGDNAGSVGGDTDTN